MIENLCIEILAIEVGRPTLIGVDGVDGAGKSHFAKTLAEKLSALSSRNVMSSSIDFFHNPRAARTPAGVAPEKSFFLNSFNYEALKKKLLDPLKSKDTGKCMLRHFDHYADVETRSEWVDFDRSTILVFDGIFLHRDELVEYWDYSIFLEAPFTETFKRMAARDGSASDPRDPSNARYFGGQNLYLKNCAPMERATVVIDNSDFLNPVRK